MNNKKSIEEFTDSLVEGSLDLQLNLFLNTVRQGQIDLHDDLLFKESIRRVHSVLKISDDFFSSTIQIDRPTIEKWKNGQSLPNLQMRLGIYMWIERKIDIELRLIKHSN